MTMAPMLPFDDDLNVETMVERQRCSLGRSRKQVSIVISAKLFYRRLPMHYSIRTIRDLSATAELLNIVCVGHH